MNYLELQQNFYQTFPEFVMKIVLAFIVFAIIKRLLKSKRFVRILCRFVLLIPVLLVAIIIHITKH